jgi:hypothetical protein
MSDSTYVPLKLAPTTIGAVPSKQPAKPTVTLIVLTAATPTSTLEIVRRIFHHARTLNRRQVGSVLHARAMPQS